MGGPLHELNYTGTAMSDVAVRMAYVMSPEFLQITLEYTDVRSAQQLRVVCQDMSSIARSESIVIEAGMSPSLLGAASLCMGLSITLMQGELSCQDVFVSIRHTFPRLRCLDITWFDASVIPTTTIVVPHGLTHVGIIMVGDAGRWHLVISQLAQSLPASLESMFFHADQIVQIEDGIMIMAALGDLLLPQLRCGFRKLIIRLVCTNSETMDHSYTNSHAIDHWHLECETVGHTLTDCFPGSSFFLINSDISVAST